MPETKAADPSQREGGQHDRRAMVLVMVGLCICLPHLYRGLHSPPESPLHGHEQHQVVWLETTAGQGSGLYWLEGSPWHWPTPYASPDRPSSPAFWPAMGDGILPAYRLSGDGQPQAIALPAQAAPIFFQPIPINQAGPEALMTIPGIGKRLAAAIIEYRDRAGGIKDRKALMAIDGIGKKKAAIIEEYVRFD